MSYALNLLSDPSLGLVREVRKPQLEMAATIEEVLEHGGVYFVEGPVGCGKTFAYLTPALLKTGRRVVVATAKKQLQDQIHLKDIPTIKHAADPAMLSQGLLTAAGIPQTCSVVLKGKSNYACAYHAGPFDPPAEYKTFLRTSKYGDLTDYPHKLPVWNSKATAEHCVGRACPIRKDCGYVALRGELASSKIVVVNHHLVGAEIAMGHGKIVGGDYDTLIIDEAHTLADGIRSAFTIRVSAGDIQKLVKEVDKAPSPVVMGKALMPHWHELFRPFEGRSDRETALETPVFPGDIDHIMVMLKDMQDEYTGLLKRAGVPCPDDVNEDIDIKALDALSDDADTLRWCATYIAGRKRVYALRAGLQAMQGNTKRFEGESDEAYLNRRTQVLANTVISGAADRHGNYGISACPIQVGGLAKKYFQGIKTVVVTSATLAYEGKFDAVVAAVGVQPTHMAALATTFDYKKQGFAYVPKNLVTRPRSDGGYNASMLEKVERAIWLCDLSKGGAFVLTTANDELDIFATHMKAAFPGKVFAQKHSRNPWDGDPPAVLAKFLETPDAILIGAKSFWEGVDVPGRQLRMVIIPRLPFPIATDPVLQALVEKAGGGVVGFNRVTVPAMITDLRQGVGRLIRTQKDLGTVAILDDRMWTKPYGATARRYVSFGITPEDGTCEKAVPWFSR